MAAQAVEWVLVIYYGPSAHRATYGRLNNTKYTKDYIQLSRKPEFLDTVNRLFPVEGNVGTVPLTFRWHTGTTVGAFVRQSADRPHLKWETNLGAPQPWKMSLTPGEAAAETIPGDPSHLDFAAAEKEFALLGSRGAGQPYLVAVKLRDEARILHLRAYLRNPSDKFAWADLRLVPNEIRSLALATSQKSALAWSVIQSGGTPRGDKVRAALSRVTATKNVRLVIDSLEPDTAQALQDYLRNPGYGLFFDPVRNHDAWVQSEPVTEEIGMSVTELVALLEERFPTLPQSDAAAEALDVDPDAVEVFRAQIERDNFEVPDATATVKTRGSAQRAFARAVKGNYAYACALTGIATPSFLVAAHIVPWSADQSIRLDPSNGICLSLLVDRAFENGYLVIADELTVRVDWQRVGDDPALRKELEPYDGRTLNAPSKGQPNVIYLQRRRAMLLASE